MNPSTLFIGQSHTHFSELDSTNSELLRMIKLDKLNEGHVVSSDFQKEGRGQRGKQWASQKGMNLMMSVLLKPSAFKWNDQFVLNMAIALGVRSFFQDKVLDEVKIKWPNDIYVNNKKVAGILLENVIKDGHIEYCVAGIGANLNQEYFEELTSASSLKLETGKYWSPTFAMQELCGFLEVFYMKLKTSKTDVFKLYNAHLYGGTWKNYLYQNQRVEAKVVSVSENGKASFQLKNEQLLTLNHGEIQLMLD